MPLVPLVEGYSDPCFQKLCERGSGVPNQRDQSSGSGDFAKMHASKLLKGVLKPRTLNPTTTNDQGSNSTSNTSDTSAAGMARGKRAFNPDNAISSTTLIPKKTITVPERAACLCAPTKHAGSFRCRLHRVNQKHWGGRLLKLQQSSTTSCNASSSGSAVQLPDGAARPKATMPHASTPGSLSLSRPGATRLSRLRAVVVAAHAESAVDHPDAIDDSTAQILGEGHVKHFKVAVTGVVTSSVAAMDGGGLALRMMNTTTVHDLRL